MGDQNLDPIDISDTSGSQEEDGPMEPASSSTVPLTDRNRDHRSAHNDTDEVPKPLSPDQQRWCRNVSQ